MIAFVLHRFTALAAVTTAITCLACLGSTAFAADSANAAARARQPNVIAILTDDQGWGDFSFQGNPTLKTPYLDALAAQSV